MIQAITPINQVLTNADVAIVTVPAGETHTYTVIITNTDTVDRLVYLHVRTAAAAQGNALLWGRRVRPNAPLSIELDSLPAATIISGKADVGSVVNMLLMGNKDA